MEDETYSFSGVSIAKNDCDLSTSDGLGDGGEIVIVADVGILGLVSRGLL